MLHLYLFFHHIFNYFIDGSASRCVEESEKCEATDQEEKPKRLLFDSRRARDSGREPAQERVPQERLEVASRPPCHEDRRAEGVRGESVQRCRRSLRR